MRDSSCSTAPGTAVRRLAQSANLPANYWIEISRLTALMANEIGQLIRQLGPDRIVFGTCMPFNYPDPAILKVEVLDASEEVKEKIRFRNALAVLGETASEHRSRLKWGRAIR